MPRIARFEKLGNGLFLHWGLYSHLGRGEWIQSQQKIPVKEYARLIERFDAAEFDPRAIARLAREAGMRCAVLTTRHHEGFSLYDTRGLSRFDASTRRLDATSRRRAGRRASCPFSTTLRWTGAGTRCRHCHPGMQRIHLWDAPRRFPTCTCKPRKASAGRVVFCFRDQRQTDLFKSANFVPADLIFVRLDKARYSTLVEQALAANFNFLRVWGGGLYASDAFYELCDEHGIVVWQEFVYACSKYPLQDEAFYTEAQREALYQVRRLSSHPSLMAWCGNNEIDMFNDWSVSDRGVVRPDYGFFHFTLRQIVHAAHPGCYYQPSSPYSPDPTASPNSDVTGDQHPWSIGFHNVDFHTYRSMHCLIS